MLKLITNESRAVSHHDFIKNLLNQADEAYIAVAFLKIGGLNLLIPFFKEETHFQILCGVNFGITDPAALSTLLSYADKSTKILPYLIKLNNKKVFHPKMYLVKKGSTCHIIIGSANLTNGGLNVNDECSLYYQCNETDSIWLESLTYFQDCIGPEKADLLGTRVISIYREYSKKQKARNALAEEFPDTTNNLIYDLTKLKVFYDRLDKTQIAKDFKLKKQHYKEAKEVLDQILSRTHPAAQFKSLLEDLVGKKGERGLWYSNGMFRGKATIFNEQALFKKLIKTIKTNVHRNPEFIYDEAKKVADKIYGLGPNFIGEIMMTYAPDKLANINSNPITVLRKEGGADIKSNSQNYNGMNYEEYNSIIKEIAAKLGLKDMLEMDYFFNEIFQKIKRDRAEQPLLLQT